jgi:hypothetical protein
LLVRFVLLSLLLIGGCPANDPTTGLQTTPVAQSADYNEFVCDVMPVLVRRCSYLGCHGNRDHAFRVYSVGKLRIDDPTTRDQRDAPLTANEIDLNFESATGLLAAATPQDRQLPDIQKIPLLLKPLAARFGGSEHHGVAVFPVFPAHTPAEDPEWNLLVNWVGGAKQPSPPTQSCQDFFTSLGVSPR